MTIYNNDLQGYYIFNNDDYYKIIEEKLGYNFLKHLIQEIIQPLKNENKKLNDIADENERDADGLLNGLQDINLEIEGLQEYITTAKRLDRSKILKMIKTIIIEINNYI